ncbi:hypothetical protein [Streptosporangium longisporum]|uniref:hypothetical protein n=1 Tax=Streptosporangium longisporum TaxID=46187 RepID=UPI0031EA7834
MDEDQRGDADREQDRAEPVDAVLGAQPGQLQRDGQHGQRDEAEGQGSRRRPSAVQVVGDEPADDERSGDHGKDITAAMMPCTGRARGAGRHGR